MLAIFDRVASHGDVPPRRPRLRVEPYCGRRGRRRKKEDPEATWPGPSLCLVAG